VIRDVTAAIVSRLEEDSRLEVRDGDTSGAQVPYVNVFVTGGLREQDRVTGPSSRVTFNVTVHSVGLRVDQVNLARESVLDLLTDWKPTVEGHQFHRVSHEVSLPPRADTDSKVTLWFGIDQFDLIAY
jgi:hypothetical protein